MSRFQLKIKLLSDTTFGRGDGVAGIIDQEVEHDPYGFPYLRGRTLKGLLSEECDNLIWALCDDKQVCWRNIADRLFGVSGSSLNTIAAVHVGDAQLPEDLRKAVANEIQEEQLTDKQTLDSLTTIRRQTSINNQTGVADEGSLRSARVALRDLEFTADLMFETETVEEEMLSLLAVGALALRHLGSGRNRGRGHVRCTLCDSSGQDITKDRIRGFEQKENQTA